MNWIDKAISAISPRAGYQRESWRLSLKELQKNYDAGDFSRLNAKWSAFNDSGEYTDRASRDIVRARARDMERNSDITNALISSYRRNVVGSGFNMQARTPDDKVNQQLEELWKEWCKKKNCDITARQSFVKILRMIEQRKRVDGGILIHKCYTDGGIIPFKLQLLEVDELEQGQLTPKYAGDKVVGGIELNKYNKAVGYWIRQYRYDEISIEPPVFIPEKDMIYICDYKRPSQIREISEMAPVLTRIRDVNEYITAVSVKERITACLAVFIKQALPQGVGRGDPKKKKEYDGKTLTPGMIKMLNPGDEIETVTPAQQASDATAFVKQHQRLISSGQGVSYESTSRDMAETNYSSARQSMIEDDLTFEDDKDTIEEFMDEVYETFVISAVLSGSIQIKGFWENKKSYMKHEWIREPKRWIDPYKESMANMVAMKTGQKTFKQISAENGQDWKERIDDMAEIEAYARSKGVAIGGETIGETEIDKRLLDDDPGDRR